LDGFGNPVESALVSYAGMTELTGPDGRVAFIAVEGSLKISAEKEGYGSAEDLLVAEPGYEIEAPIAAVAVEKPSQDYLSILIIIASLLVIASSLAFHLKRR
jgi:hypothetical protein